MGLVIFLEHQYEATALPVGTPRLTMRHKRVVDQSSQKIAPAALLTKDCAFEFSIFTTHTQASTQISNPYPTVVAYDKVVTSQKCLH